MLMFLKSINLVVFFQPSLKPLLKSYCKIFNLFFSFFFFLICIPLTPLLICLELKCLHEHYKKSSISRTSILHLSHDTLSNENLSITLNALVHSPVSSLPQPTSMRSSQSKIWLLSFIWNLWDGQWHALEIWDEYRDLVFCYKSVKDSSL